MDWPKPFFRSLEFFAWAPGNQPVPGRTWCAQSRGAMNAEYIVTGIIALLLLGYLLVALLKPEKF